MAGHRFSFQIQILKILRSIRLNCLKLLCGLFPDFLLPLNFFRTCHEIALQITAIFASNIRV